MVRFESVRTLLSLASNYNLKLHQMDVSAAFLNGELDEEIYLSQPPGFVVEGKENYFCRLRKSLYGFKQSLHCWNNSFDQFIKELGFLQSTSDACIYVKGNASNLCVVAVYVDDLIIGCSSDMEIDKINSAFCNRFEMKIWVSYITSLV